MRIAEGIEMLEISATVMGKQDIIHPTLLWDNENAVLIDTAYPGQMPQIVEAIGKAGIPVGKLSKIIITHQDLDHIGGLPDLVREASHEVKVLANKTEVPYIQGEKTLLKITPETIEAAMKSLPPEVPEEWRQAFKAVLENPPRAAVDRTVEDGEMLPYCGGITVIHTPGHTPGHISLYHHASKTLIAADALVVAGDQLHGPHPQYSVDLQAAMLSVRKLLSYDIEAVICYHGGLYKGNANRRIAELTEAIND